MKNFIINYLKQKQIFDFSKFELRDDGKGVYISVWNYDIEKPVFPSPSEIILMDKIENKLQELDNYHYNDISIRQCKINNYFILSLTGEGRSLIQEQITNLVQQIKLGLIVEQDASFEYFYNGGSIEISLVQLRRIYIGMLNIVNSNYQNYKAETYLIKNLSTVEAVESHDFTTNYLKNQNINL